MGGLTQESTVVADDEIQAGLKRIKICITLPPCVINNKCVVPSQRCFFRIESLVL